MIMKVICMTFLIFFSLYAFGKDMKIKFSDSTIPYIVEYEKLKVKNSFNNEITKILNTLQCNVKQRKSVKSFWENYTKIGYTKNDIVSIKIRSNYNCDGTHPYNDVDHSLTYDMENNRVITLYDIFLKKEETFKLIKNSFYKSIKDGSCREKIKFYLESEKLFKEYLSFYFDKKGIVFKLNVPYGIRFCINDVEIKYAEIINKSAYTGPLKKLEKEYKIKKED